jgi:thymidylate synthase (FAD)
MRLVEPEVFLIARPTLDIDRIDEYLQRVGGQAWLERVEPLWQWGGPASEGEALVEFAGRLCYRSWEPGLNKNVTRVRTSIQDYLDNILQSKHGSVLEHGFYVFVFHHISRVCTHEIVRHRVGTSISQESLRFVRLDDLPFWLPEWAQADAELSQRCLALLQVMEAHQRWMAGHFGLDDPGKPFGVKKFHTSFMRRFAPEGVATGMVWGANLRSLRHVIEMRTAEHAEEEIRRVFGQVARLMRAECPHLFHDLEVVEVDGLECYRPRYSKV